MSELKPCPFCGEMPQANKWITYGKKPQEYMRYVCVNDTCPNRLGEPKSKLLDEWNTRPIEDELRKRIAELESAQRWIPVSERLPETYKPVLTVDMSEATQVPVPAFYNPDTECWSTHFKYDLWVTHWMPLPEPPIVYGKVCEE